MSIEELVDKLKEIAARQEDRTHYCDRQENHSEADGLILSFIDDQRVTDAYHSIEKWYA